MIIDPKVWQDISTQTVRTYQYPNGFQFNVAQPKLLNIQNSSLGGHAHRIQTEDGTGVYVAPGWVAIYWKVKEGEPLFKF